MFKCVAAVVALLASAAAVAEVVPVTGGAIEGVTTGAVTAFKGVPYAASPTGANRWRAPQPVVPWKGVRSAASFGHDCAQAPFPPDAAPILTKPDEDCLFLNLWKPATAKAGSRLPVMVWVHGGGFVNGGTSPKIYSGANFARDGVVFVSLNYRLGRFGFFAHPALAAEGFGGNFGFLDQLAALKWVRANIARFGGDPARVTVLGESAGGMSMHMLLQTPLARGLFAGVIVQSGGGRDAALPQPTLARAAIAGSRFAPGLTAAQLRALPQEKITGDLSMMTSRQPGYSGPMVDGKTIMGPPIDAAAAGLAAQVPVIIGSNSADGFSFETDKNKIFADFGADAAAARALYDPDGNRPALHAAIAVSADRAFREPARAVARELSARQNVWLYRFGFAPQLYVDQLGGAPHASEISYAFDTVADRIGPKVDERDHAAARIMHRYWVNFAKTGRPDSEGVPAWPKVVPGDTTVQLIDGQGAVHAVDPVTAQLDFTESRATR